MKLKMVVNFGRWMASVPRFVLKFVEGGTNEID